MINKITTLFIAALAVLVVTGPEIHAGEASLESFKGLSGEIDIAGGTAHIPVMKEAAKRIMQYNPNIKFTIAGGGSGVGVQKVGNGLVDIGNTGRPVSEAEKKKYGIQTFPFAIDGVCVAVHPSNPVGNLTDARVRDIFAGRVSGWSELGGSGGAINLYTRDEASGTRAVFWKKLLDKGDIARRANVVPSNGAMKVALSRDKNAIGYLSMGHVDETVKPVNLNGVAPTRENAVQGHYKVVRKLYMNTKGEPSPLVKTFINYVKGPEGAEIVGNHGFIPISN